METANKRERHKITRSRLRKLSKTNHHGARSTARIFKYGTKSFIRNIWLSAAATAVMTITLVILFITIVASVILSNTADDLRDKIDITVFLRPGTSEQTLADLSEILKTDANIKPETITTNTSAEELNIFIGENSDNTDLINTLSDPEMKAIMSETMQSTIRFKLYDTENIDSIKALISENELFADSLDESKAPTYDINKKEIKTVNTWAKIAKNGGIILGIIFLVISILIIFNTVRMAIFSRREEIYMMRLVGANKSFIRGPFLVETQLSGLIAGLLSATISYFGFNFLSPKLAGYGIDTTFINTILSQDNIILLYLAMILTGIIINTFAANLATRHYLRKAK